MAGPAGRACIWLCPEGFKEQPHISGLQLQVKLGNLRYVSHGVHRQWITAEALNRVGLDGFIAYETQCVGWLILAVHCADRFCQDVFGVPCLFLKRDLDKVSSQYKWGFICFDSPASSGTNSHQCSHWRQRQHQRVEPNGKRSLAPRLQTMPRQAPGQMLAGLAWALHPLFPPLWCLLGVQSVPTLAADSTQVFSCH